MKTKCECSKRRYMKYGARFNNGGSKTIGFLLLRYKLCTFATHAAVIVVPCGHVYGWYRTFRIALFATSSSNSASATLPLAITQNGRLEITACGPRFRRPETFILGGGASLRDHTTHDRWYWHQHQPSGPVTSAIPRRVGERLFWRETAPWRKCWTAAWPVQNTNASCWCGEFYLRGIRCLSDFTAPRIEAP